MKTLKQYLEPETTVEEFYLETSESHQLKLFRFSPPTKNHLPTLFIIGGLATIIESFGPFLAEASKFFVIHYFETREKRSSQLSENAQFEMDVFSSDLAIVTYKLYGNKTPFVVFGYSMGATIVMDAFSKFKYKPQALILLSPTASFNYPAWSLFLMKHSLWMKSGWLKWVGKWYMGRYVVNRKEDPEMYAISMKAIDSADPPKIKKTILAVNSYRVWDKLSAIDSKTLVVATSKDGIHLKDEVRRIAEMILGSEYLDLETNDRTHGPEMAHVVLRFLNIRVPLKRN